MKLFTNSKRQEEGQGEVNKLSWTHCKGLLHGGILCSPITKPLYWVQKYLCHSCYSVPGLLASLVAATNTSDYKHKIYFKIPNQNIGALGESELSEVLLSWNRKFPLVKDPKSCLRYWWPHHPRSHHGNGPDTRRARASKCHISGVAVVVRIGLATVRKYFGKLWRRIPHSIRRPVSGYLTAPQQAPRVCCKLL